MFLFVPHPASPSQVEDPRSEAKRREARRGSEESMTAHCPECDNAITLEKPLRGEIVVCSDCGSELEVTSENPLVLNLAPQEEEDWGE